MKRNPKRAAKYPGGHLALPKAVMRHDDFRTLTPSAVKVLMVLGEQYTGSNNGRLSATRRQLARDWCGMSHTTLSRALRELRQRNLITCTREHIKTHSGAKPALYALAWLPVDDCHPDVEPTQKPPRSLV